jgi:hypothetical protein
MYAQVPKRIERINYLLTAVLGAIGLVFLETPYALGLVIGAAIASLHFTGLRWIVDRVRTAPGQKRLAFGMLLVPHLLLTMAAVVLAMAYIPLSPGALLIGFSIFLISIVAGTLQEHFSPSEERASS